MVPIRDGRGHKAKEHPPQSMLIHHGALTHTMGNLDMLVCPVAMLPDCQRNLGGPGEIHVGNMQTCEGSVRAR